MGSYINTTRIGSVVFGIITAGFATGLSHLVSTLWQTLIIDPANGLANFLHTLISAVLNVPTALFGSATQSGSSFAISFGVLGFFVALALVIVAAYLVAQEVQFL